MQGKRQRAADLAFCLLTASPRLQQLPLVSNNETPSLPLSPAAHKRTNPHKAGLHVNPGVPLAVAVWSWCRWAGWRCLHGSVGGCSSDWYIASPAMAVKQSTNVQTGGCHREVTGGCGSWCSSMVHSDWCKQGRGPWLDHFNAVNSNWTESERASQRNGSSELCQRGKQRATINDLFSFQLSQQWLRGRREYKRASSEVRIIQNQQRWNKRRRLMNSDQYTHTNLLVHGNTLKNIRVSKTDYTCNNGHLSYER